MQQSGKPANAADAKACAAAVLDVGLTVSRLVRAQVRKHGPGGLSLPQVRALAFVNGDPDCAPSQLAEYLMLSRPAVTRLLDALVRRGLLTRRADPADRRRLKLSLTRAGRARLESYFERARALVAERLASLSARDRREVARVMRMVLPTVVAVVDTADGAR